MKLIDRLFDGPLDVIGDVHGEIEALDRLLAKLGYKRDGRHPDGRRLVFLGDLTDRGPDSPAVLERVAALVDAGRAQCITGNHELNLMRDVPKHGNDWWVRPQDADTRLPAEPITPAAKARFMDWLASLPLALERDDLRVVHACWDEDAIETLRRREADGVTVLELFDEYQARHLAYWRHGEGQDRLRRERAGRDRSMLYDRSERPAFLPAYAQMDSEHQSANPVALLTSGPEAPTRLPFWAGGRWRMVERVKWWESYEAPVPVLVGHYWRRYSEVPPVYADKYGPDLFAGIEPHQWMGARSNVYCVDFSVGGRSEQRYQDQPEYLCQLAAMRVPEWQVVHDDGDRWEVGPPGSAESGPTVGV